MTFAVAILMKDPRDAKTRLGDVLSAADREALALSLFENTLAFFVRFQRDAPLCVVTPSLAIAEIAWRHGVEHVDDEAGGTINHAAQAAAVWARHREAHSLLIMHADIPVISETEITALLAAGRSAAVVIVESKDGGTNALMVTPPDAIPFHYGPLSASKHQLAAQQRRLPCTRQTFEHLSTDLDDAADLAQHLARRSTP